MYMLCSEHCQGNKLSKKRFFREQPLAVTTALLAGSLPGDVGDTTQFT
jgi:hypothetical protein